MSCLEKECRDCGYWWSDNHPSRVCPRCGNTYTSVFFDEYDDHHEPEENDYE